MAKVTVIDVDLGISVSDIIAKNFEKLSQKAQQTLDTAIEMQKKVEEKKAQSKTKKQLEEEMMDKIFTKIEESGSTGVSTEELMEIGKRFITTTSALTTRIKSMLRHKENPYRLRTVKKDKKQLYLFESYNEESL